MNHLGDTNKMVSETPRTDKEAFFPNDSKYRVCDGDFARQLERELAAANDRIKRLEEWKESAMAVEREWDANAISTMLGGHLGESQRVVIMREVPRLLERVKRLEEALESIREYWNRDNNNQALIDACWYAIDKAAEALEAKEAKP